MSDKRIRELKMEELPLEVQEQVKIKERGGTPLKEIQVWLKEEYGFDITPKSLMRFSTKKIDLKIEPETKKQLDDSFKDSIDNVRELNAVNKNGLRNLSMSSKSDDKDWFNNLNIVSRSCMETFKTHYSLLGQKVTEEGPKTSTTEDLLNDAISQGIEANKLEKSVKP